MTPTRTVEHVRERLIDLEISHNDQDADENALHLIHTELPGCQTVCGAPPSLDHAGCPSDGRRWRGEGRCPGCQRVVCCYCRLLGAES